MKAKLQARRLAVFDGLRLEAVPGVQEVEVEG